MSQKSPAEMSLGQWYSWIAILFFICSFPFSLFLPLWVSWENQILENAQAAVLILGAIIAFCFGLKAQGRMRVFWFSMVPIWIIMFARELSWGAVFFAPTSVSEEGPMFASSELWYHPYRTPVVLVIVAGIAIGFARSRAPRILFDLIAERKFPFFEIAGFVVAMLVSTAAENHLRLSLDSWPGHHQIVEETMELAAYIFIVAAQQKIWTSLTNDTRRNRE